MHVPTHRNGAHPNGHTQTPTPTPDATPPAAEGQRDAHGRFAEGNLGGPGNPFARQVAALRKALLAAVSEGDVEGVARELVRQAKGGNVAAAKLLLSYTLGKPVAPSDPDTLDAQEWAAYRDAPDPLPDVGPLLRRMPLPFACDTMRFLLPGLAGSWQKQVGAGLQQHQQQEQREAAARQGRAARRRDRAERRRQERAAAAQLPGEPPAAPTPADEAAALDVLARLLGMWPGGAPSANGGVAPDVPWRLVPPPSANGGAPPDQGRD
jgi:hypothetical protein